MPDAVNPEIAKNAMLHRFTEFLAKSASPADIAMLLGDVVAKGEASASPLSTPIADLWTGEKGTVVPNAADLNIGGGTASRGTEPSALIDKFSPSQVIQTGATNDATHLGEIVNGLNAIRKAINDHIAKANAHVQDYDVLKAVVIKLSKAEPEAKEEKKEAKEDDEFSKAVSAIVAKASPIVAEAQAKFETAKSMVAEGFAAQAEFARFGGVELIMKAKKLIEAAKAIAPADAAVLALAKAVDDAKDEFGNKDSEKKEETAKSETAKSASGALPPELTQKFASFEQGLADLAIHKSTLADMMAKVSGHLPEVAKGKPDLPVAVQATTLEGLQKVILEKRDSGALDENMTMAAMDLAAYRVADAAGSIAKGMYEAKLNLAPDAVKTIFQAAA